MVSNLVKATMKMEKGEMKTRPLLSQTTLSPPHMILWGIRAIFNSLYILIAA